MEPNIMQKLRAYNIKYYILKKDSLLGDFFCSPYSLV